VTALLSAEEISVAYGGIRALDGVSVELREGSVVGVLGPNGAGKTTLVDALSGFVRPTHGRISFSGRRIERLPPHRRAQLGVVRTFQSLQLFDDLTVGENLLVAAEHPRPHRERGDGPREPAASVVEHALGLAGAAGLVDRLPSELPHGVRGLVSMARALAMAPRVLLLDEPAAGLDSVETRALGERLEHLREAGIAVLLVDHDTSLVLGACDVVYVLDRGRLIASGTPDEVRRDAGVIQAYLGEAAAPLAEGVS
jgi:branched-chain amino acid transport system ATP-binding protein